MRFNTKLLALYKNTPLRYKVYTAVRCAVCSFDEIERCIPRAGKILDCGCGHGILANLLAMKSDRRYVVGADINKEKIRVATSTLAGRRNIEFNVDDLERSVNTKDVRCFTFIDVLCYVPLEQKRELLKKIYNILPAKGVLVIKSVQEFPRWKYWFILFHMGTIDKVMHRGFRGNAHFIRKEEYLKLLEDIGFEVRFKDISRGYPYPNCLYICTKVK